MFVDKDLVSSELVLWPATTVSAFGRLRQCMAHKLPALDTTTFSNSLSGRLWELPNDCNNAPIEL